MSEEEKWKCRCCGCELSKRQVVFDYLSLTFSEKVLRCPKCGRVLIPKDLAVGKMVEVEAQLEDK
ncbi:DVU_1557 family redox protein [Parasporobacterium paucivorans]|uniref:DUF7479 domain-containing protein n=1 Tax=Parasporobacterium paucivorans DSM 15970 TaxID=1122934 RepID=A0A1M6HV13_9FIRM|nr:CLJU_RS11820 family redox protein [Parasporobacterium paucivorans]SHJ26045.1 hypothetical protein SAMN02745691_01614 [Parasporobacterium paucivorans DSM 15970]